MRRRFPDDFDGRFQAEFRRKSALLVESADICQFFSDKVFFKILKFNNICQYFHFATKNE